MDNSTIALKPVKDLMGMNFFIPDYQRGYRWTAQQATDLLEDIREFADKKKGPAEIYCVQPLVVQRKTEDIKEQIQKKMDADEHVFTAYVEKLIKGGVRVVCATQCTYDGVNLSVYPIGTLAKKLGAESAETFTIEASLFKLMIELAK